MIYTTSEFQGMRSRTVFSDCRKWRFVLERRWSDAPVVNFILLNPSTADEVKNDPTVERQQRRVMRWSQDKKDCVECGGTGAGRDFYLGTSIRFGGNCSTCSGRGIKKSNPLGGIVVTNLFAWRSTDPKELLRCADPVGVGNDRQIIIEAQRAGLVICGWGSHKAVGTRGDHVLKMLRAVNVKPMALKITTKEPWHPLYVAYPAVPFEIPEVALAR